MLVTRDTVAEQLAAYLEGKRTVAEIVPRPMRLRRRWEGPVQLSVPFKRGLMALLCKGS